MRTHVMSLKQDVLSMTSELQAKTAQVAELQGEMAGLRAAHVGRLGVVQSVEWQYEAGGCCSAVEPAATEKLLQAYMAYLSTWYQQDQADWKTEVEIQSGGRAYRVNFDSMSQVNLATQMRRSNFCNMMVWPGR